MNTKPNISPEQETDALLWRRFKNGDPDALGALAELHYQSLYNYGTKFSKDSEFIRDCIQDLYGGLWEKRVTISETDFVKSYLFKSLRHKIFKESIRLKRFQQPEDLSFDGGDTVNSIESVIIRNDQDLMLSSQLNKIISGLTNRQREVVYLRFYQGLDHNEIAEIMELGRQSTANLLYRTLKEMKEQWVLSDFLVFLLLMVS